MGSIVNMNRQGLLLLLCQRLSVSGSPLWKLRCIGELFTAALRKCRRGARVNDTPAQGLNGPGENRGEYVIRLVWPYSIERSKER